jgi:hypothetical protein
VRVWQGRAGDLPQAIMCACLEHPELDAGTHCHALPTYLPTYLPACLLLLRELWENSTSYNATIFAVGLRCLKSWGWQAA